MKELNCRLNALPEWQYRIIVANPLLYLDAHDDCRLQYGFECEAGWAPLLEKLSATGTALVRALRAFGFQSDARIEVLQVKQKLGQMRWHDTTNLLPPFLELWWSAKTGAERESTHICEVTGRPGVLRDVGHGWLRTLSEEEFMKERRKKR